MLWHPHMALCEFPFPFILYRLCVVYPQKLKQWSLPLLNILSSHVQTIIQYKTITKTKCSCTTSCNQTLYPKKKKLGGGGAFEEHKLCRLTEIKLPAKKENLVPMAWKTKRVSAAHYLKQLHGSFLDESLEKILLLC